MPFSITSGSHVALAVPTIVPTADPEKVRVHNGWTHRGEPVQVASATFDTMVYVDRKLQQGRQQLPFLTNQVIDAARGNAGREHATLDALRAHPQHQLERRLLNGLGGQLTDVGMRHARYAESIRQFQVGQCEEAAAVSFANLVEESHGAKTYIVSTPSGSHAFAGAGGDPQTDKPHFVAADLWCPFGTAHPLSDGLFKDVRLVAEWPAGIAFKAAAHPPLELAQVDRMIKKWVEPYTSLRVGTETYHMNTLRAAANVPFSAAMPDRMYAATGRPPRRFNEFSRSLLEPRIAVIEDMAAARDEQLERLVTNATR